MKELSLYLAYWIGSKQSLQPTINTYVKNLEKVSDMVARIDQLINKYEREIDALSVFKKQMQTSAYQIKN